MSKNEELPVRTTGTGDDQVYYLRSGDATADTEITKKQYDSIIEFGQGGSTGSANLTEANILRLHQEQDPASEFYKGELANDTIKEQPEKPEGYYDLNAANTEGAQVTGEASGDTISSTEDVTKGPVKSAPADKSDDADPETEKA